MLRLSRLSALALAVSSLVSAQTWTSCNPLNTTCGSDEALGLNKTVTFNFTNSIADDVIWNTTAGTINYETEGAEFTINQKGDSPTIQSNFYIFFGRVSVIMKAASGQGIVSSVVLESDDLDEIDWEFIGGNSTYAETNYFSKGDTSTYNRAVWMPVDDVQELHNYTTHWTAEAVQWWIDGALVRTLEYSTNTSNYPQTPMTIRLGIWAGGDTTENSNGTVEWAGGDVNYSKGPFTMLVQSLQVDDFSTGSSYTYGDKSGDWQSIKIASGNSTIAERLSQPSAKDRWNALPKVAKIVIACAVIGTAAVAAAVFAFFVIKSRRTGKKERLLADAEWEKEVMEMQDYKRAVAAEQEMPLSSPGSRMGSRVGSRTGFI